MNYTYLQEMDVSSNKFWQIDFLRTNYKSFSYPNTTFRVFLYSQSEITFFSVVQRQQRQDLRYTSPSRKSAEMNVSANLDKISLVYTTRDVHLPSVTFCQNPSDNLWPSAAMITFFPEIPSNLTQEQAFLNLQLADGLRKNLIIRSKIRSEYVFILDRSGSMKPEFMQILIDAMLVVIDDLPETVFFNIYSFGTNFEALFVSDNHVNPELRTPILKIANSSNKEFARQYILTFTNNMGGTDIFKPLQNSFLMPIQTGYSRYIFQLTDGVVARQPDCLDLISSRCQSYPNLDIISIGLGLEADTVFLQQAAQACGSAYRYISSFEDSKVQLLSLLNSTYTQFLETKEVDYEVTQISAVVPLPNNSRSIKAGEPFIIYLLFNSLFDYENGASQDISLALYDSSIQDTVQYIVSINNTSTSQCRFPESDSLHRQAILKMVQISLLQATLSKDELSGYYQDQFTSSNFYQKLKQLSLQYRVLSDINTITIPQINNKFYDTLWCTICLIDDQQSAEQYLTTSNQGILYYNYLSEWRQVCSNLFDLNDAVVACTQMAKQNGWDIQETLSDITFELDQDCSQSNFTSSTDYFWLNRLECTGCEQQLGSCRSEGFGKQSLCSSFSCVKLSCSGKNFIEGEVYLDQYQVGYESLSVDRGYFLSSKMNRPNAQVICRQMARQEGFNTFDYTQILRFDLGQTCRTPLTNNQTRYVYSDLSCTGLESLVESCPHTQKNSVTPSMNQCVRLICGNNRTTRIEQGYAQYFYLNQWRPICADSFTVRSAQVFCRNLALDIRVQPESMRLISYSFDLCPTSSYWINKLNCTGDESSIDNCAQQLPYGTGQCQSQECVKISCVVPLNCLKGTFMDFENIICAECHLNCSQCNGPNFQDCTGETVNDCNQGQIWSVQQRRCINQCHPNCTTCLSPAFKDCTKVGESVYSCEAIEFFNTTTQTCEPNNCTSVQYYNYQDERCCHHNCYGCFGPSKEECNGECPVFYYFNQTIGVETCMPCNEDIFCLSCTSNLIEDCLDQRFCNESEYLDPVTLVCYPCIEGCLRCRGPTIDECREFDDSKSTSIPYPAQIAIGVVSVYTVTASAVPVVKHITAKFFSAAVQGIAPKPVTIGGIEYDGL